jgi:glycosyltransferase involved in cell wall biosynthesis
VRDILERHPQATLDLVGDDTIPGPGGRTYREAFQAQHLDVEDRVRFHGKVDEARLRGFYADCDLLIAPSRFESFGLVLLEGMIFGKPVVGCRVGGMVEVVEDEVTGLLAEPGDPASLAACLSRLVEDPALRSRLGAAGRARYEARFTPEAMARGVRDLMLDAAAR